MEHTIATMLDVEPTPFVIHYAANQRGTSGVRVWRDSAGQMVDRRIELTADARDALRFLIAHELVHWCKSGPWDRLPHTIEEGFADYVALNLAPEFAIERRELFEARLKAASTEEMREVLVVDARDWPALPDDSKLLAYAVGFRVVEAVGLDGLRALCVRADAEQLPTIPPSWIVGWLSDR